ncbi:MAG: ABC transporter permease [Elusimicrobia bacterium]|nr:ABC transporter permease [Elusimicrobiota bacterium]
MRISESLRTGTLEIFHHKMRSFLSFFAISIGVISILYSLTLIYSMSTRTKKALELAGPGRMTVRMKRNYGNESSSDAKEAKEQITLEDALAVRHQFPELYMVAPSLKKWVEIRHETLEDDNVVEGVDTQWSRRGWVYTLKGRFINQYDIDHFSRVCVLIKEGGWFKKPMWYKFYSWTDKFQDYIKHNYMLGKTLKLGNTLYTVVGILEEPPQEKNPLRSIMVSDQRSNVLVPITTAQRFLSGWAWSSGGVDEINIDTGDEKTIDAYKRKAEKFVQQRHGGRMRGMEVKDFREMIKEKLADKQRDMYTVLIIGAIAILAGGIGIMNVTLATIFSRIKEIGIRRAIGATRSDIMAQFMIEAMLLGLFGGVAGILVGMAGVQYLASKGDTDMMMFQWWMPFISVLAAVLTGFFAALYPAYQASKLDPVEALRYE